MESAPGPDGTPGRTSALVQGGLCIKTLQQLNKCQQKGKFPIIWKLVCAALFKKQGQTPDSATAYRSTSLFSEAWKLLERVLAIRLKEQLLGMGPDLNDKEYGFRRVRSTFDARRSVRSLTDAAVHTGGVVSLANSSLSAIITRVVKEKRLWRRMAAFFKQVMLHKEAAEWVTVDVAPIRMGRMRRRARRDFGATPGRN
ncbi:uncharacterized protein LOC143220751 [Lasioglossum baleicum]|uniref:uncharacterized protein LOC143220751 n=1 Tax=Lasioglossum baleicum TaxID=434251 RepID=UPI003FCCB983